MKWLSVVVFALAFSACTSREWYESANASAKFECNKLQPGAREECMAKVNKTPYDSYEKERSKQTP